MRRVASHDQPGVAARRHEPQRECPPLRSAAVVGDRPGGRIRALAQRCCGEALLPCRPRIAAHEHEAQEHEDGRRGEARADQAGPPARRQRLRLRLNRIRLDEAE